MASLAMEIGADGDNLLLPPLEEVDETDDDGDEIIQRDLFGNVLLHTRVTYTVADLMPQVIGAMAARYDAELGLAVDEALETVEAPSDGRDCPICLRDDDTAAEAAWKETPCGHLFHGRCVEPWLRGKGSCPMCRHQLLTMPAVRPPYGVTQLPLHGNFSQVPR